MDIFATVTKSWYRHRPAEAEREHMEIGGFDTEGLWFAPIRNVARTGVVTLIARGYMSRDAAADRRWLREQMRRQPTTESPQLPHDVPRGGP